MHGDLTAVIVGLLLFFAGYRIGFSRGRRPFGAAQPRPPNTNVSDEDIRTELRAGRKIEAIKLYRQRSGCGLKVAKDAVEVIDASMGHLRSVR